MDTINKIIFGNAGGSPNNVGDSYIDTYIVNRYSCVHILNPSSKLSM